MDKPRMLFFAQFPEPTHGAALRNKELYNSQILNKCFQIHKVEIQTANDIKDIGGVRVLKILKLIKIIFQCFIFSAFYRPEVLYVTLSTSGLGFWKDSIILFICKFFSNKNYIHLRCYGLSEYINSPIKRLWAKYVFSNVNAFVLSESLKRDCYGIIDEDKIFVVGNCIDTAGLPSNIKNEVTEKPNFYHISNLSESKGTVTILKAVKELYKSGWNGAMHLIGPWHDKKSQLLYEEIISKDPSIRDVLKYHGPLYGKDKFNLISAMNVHVFPSKYKKECFPGVILEAMHFSIPTISTNHAAIPDMVKDGVTGKIIDIDDYLSLKNEILNYSNDVDLIFKHGVNAFELYKDKFTSLCVHSSILKELNK